MISGDLDEMELVVTSLLNGLTFGLLLFMVSAGLTLIFGMMSVINFAHAWFYMVGAYAAYIVSRYFPYYIVLLVAPLLVAAVGIATERYLLRPVHQYGHTHEILVTFGLALIIEEMIKIFFGNYPVDYRPPSMLNFTAFTVYGMDYPFYKIFVAAVALFMLAILIALMKLTRAGLVIRAAVKLPSMVEALGHNVPRIFLLCFAIGAWLAGLAGVVGGAYLTTSPTMALQFGINVFVVVVIGGLGSIRGAFVASLAVGLLTSFAARASISIGGILGHLGIRSASTAGSVFAVDLSVFAQAIPVLAMLAVLVVRPRGMFGEAH